MATAINQRPRTTARTSHPSAMTWELFALGLDACDRELDDLREYLSLTQEFLERKKRDFQEDYREVLHREDFQDHFDTDIQQLWVGFPALLNNSAFVSACSCLEGYLTELCKNIETDVAVQQKWEDLSKKEGAVDRAKTYLSQNFGISIGNYRRWSTIRDYYRLRNCIVHALGDPSLMAAPTDIEAVVKRLGKGVSQDKSGRISLEASFVRDAVKEFSQFWRALQDALEDNEVLGPKYWP